MDGSLNDAYLAQMSRTADHLAVWMPIRRLLVKARRHRAAEIERLRGDEGEVGRLDGEEVRRRRTRPFFGHVPGMEVDYEGVRERWLALVRPGAGEVGSGSVVESTEGVSTPVYVSGRGHPAEGTPGGMGAGAGAGVGVGGGGVQIPEGMDYIDNLMDEPFNPINFFRSAYTPPVDMGVGVGTTNHPSTAPTTTAGAADASAGGGPRKRISDSPPPFLWSGGWTDVGKGASGVGFGMGGGAGAGVGVDGAPGHRGGSGAGTGTGVGTGAGMGMWGGMGVSGGAGGVIGGGIHPDLEDASMNLDEEFNWESWQESVREMEGMAGRPMPGWGL